MNKKLLPFCLLCVLAGCEEIPVKPTPVALDYDKLTNHNKYAKLLIDAENKASPSGKKVLATGREMALLKKEVVKGSCWDYANAVYKKAGFAAQKDRKVLLNKKQAGDFDLKNLQPGDFLSYINHSYHDIAHSAIFVDWMDFQKKVALMLSYAGQNSTQPARYRPYDVSDVFYVARATPPKSAAVVVKQPVEEDEETELD